MKMMRIVERFANARTVEGKVVSVILALTLALMAWDANAMRYAFADEDATLTTQAKESESKSDDSDKSAAKEEKSEAKSEQVEEKAAPEEKAPEPAAEEKAEPAQEPAPAAEPAKTEEPAPAEKPAADTPAKTETPAAQEEVPPADVPVNDEPAAPADTGNAAANDTSASQDDTPKATDTAKDDTDKKSSTSDEEEKPAEVTYPAVVLYGKAGGTTVKVTAPKGSLPEGAQLLVSDVSSEALANRVEQATGDELGAYQAIDITLVDKNNHEIQPKKAVVVTFVGTGLDNDHVNVCHISGGSVEEVSTNQADANTQTFQASSFSIYFVYANVGNATYYSVKFLNDDESVISEQSEKEEGKAIGFLPQDPFKAGYHFTGWKNQETDEAVTAETVVTGDIAAVAQYEEIKVYRVTVEYWYHNPTTDADTTFSTAIVEMEKADAPKTVESPASTNVSADVDAEHPVYIPEQPTIEITLDDLLAVGDTVDENGKGVVTKRVKFVPYNTTYYFVYKLKDLDGKSYTEVDRTAVEGVMGSTVTPNVKDIEGGVFEKTEAQVITDAEQELDVYYTRASCPVTYAVNGGDYIDTQMVEYGASTTLPTATRTGYTFGGWYKDEGLTQKVDGDTLEVTAPVMLYAKWTAKTVNYTVVYLIENADDDEYSFLTSVTKKAATDSKVTETNKGTVPSDLDKKNFTFKESTTEIVKADGSTVVTVKYSRNVYTIKWNGDVYNTSNKRRAQNQGTGSVTAKFEANITQQWVAVFNNKYPNYAWSFTADNNDKTIGVDTMPSASGKAASSDGSIRLLAFDFSTTKQQQMNYWLENYEGAKTTTRNGKTYGLYKTVTGKFNLLYDDSDFYEIAGYAKDGYEASYEESTEQGHYEGWGLKRHWVVDEVITETKNYSLGTTTPDADLNVDFYYATNVYPLTFYTHQGALISTQQVKLNADITSYLASNIPEPPVQGAEWLGWYTDSEHANAYAGNSKMPTGLALYANWKMPERSFTFVDIQADGTQTALQTDAYPYGQAASAITPAAREGYVFQGWFADEARTQPYDFDKPLVQDTTVFSKWTQATLSYQVRYVNAETSDELASTKTVASPVLKLGQEITENAVTVAGMLPDATSKALTLQLTGNEIVFEYSKKQASVSYEVQYVLADDHSIKVAEPKKVTVSGDTVSVKEVAKAVDYDLLASQGKTGETYHPVSEVIDHSFSTGENIVTFEYYSYEAAKFVVNYLDMDGNPIPGKASATADVKIGSTFTIDAALEGYAFNRVDGYDRKTTFVASSSGTVELNAYFQKNLSIAAVSKKKPYDGEPLVSSGVDDIAVTGLMDSHKVEGISFVGSQTMAGSSATTPADARISGPASGNYYRITYTSGTLTVEAQNVTVIIKGEQVETAYDGEEHTATYEVESISNKAYSADYIQYNGESDTVSRTDAGRTDLILNGMFSTKAEYAGSFNVSFQATNGYVDIERAELSIYTDSAEKTYDGTPLRASGARAEGLQNGETVVLKTTTTRTDVSTDGVWNEVDDNLIWTGTAKMENYTVKWQNGKLKVTPATLTVTALSQAYPYSGSAQGEDNATYGQGELAAKVSLSGLAAGDALTSVTLDGSETAVGTYEKKIVPSAAEGVLGHTPETILKDGEQVDATFADNYTIEYEAGALVIDENATDLTLTATNGGGEYSGNAYGLGSVEASLANAAIEYKVGDGEWSATAPLVTNVSESQDGTISVRARLEGYTTAQVDGLSIVVTPKPVSVAAGTKTKVFGSDDPEGTLDVTIEGTIGGDTVDYTVTRTEGEAVGSYAIIPSGKASQGNYQVSFTPGTLTITSKAVIVKPIDASKTYGEDDPELAASVEGLASGDSLEYTLSRETGENAGTYIISASGETTQGNYTVSFDTGTFTIDRAVATVTADAAKKVYGEEDPAFTATVTGLVDDDAIAEGLISYAFTRETGENAGEYVLTPKGAAIQGNYNVAYVDGSLSITRATATVTADATGKVYGTSDPEVFGATITGLKFDDTDAAIAYTASRAPGENVGEYAITPAGDTVQGNYAVAYVPGTFTITKAKALVTADNASKTYGDADPELTATVAGLVGNDSVSYTLARAEGEDAGTYGILPSGAAEQGNYDVEFSGGTFTIGRAEATVTAIDAAKTYGQNDPVLTATVSGLTNGDAATAVEYSLTREPGSDAGEYTITASGAAQQGNYKVSYVPAKLSVAKAPLTITAADASKTYGEADPVYTAELDGLVNGDTAGMFSYTVSRTDSATNNNVGAYNTITPVLAGELKNYELTAKNGTLTIEPKEVTVAAASMGKVYGADDPELTATVEGTLNGDTVSYELARETGEDVGDYAITASGEAAQGNYAVSFQNGTFAISPAGTLTVSGTPYEGVYDAESHGDAAVANVTAGTTIEYSTDGGATWNATAPTRTDAGTTTVQVRATNANYTTATSSYTLTIAPKAVTVKPQDAGKTYGDADPAEFTYGVSGLVAGEDRNLIEVASIARVVGEDVNSYDITATGEAAQGNYTVSYEPGTFTISPAKVTVTAESGGKVYGDADPIFTAKVEGLKNDEPNGTIAYDLSRAEGEIVGNYTITASGEEVQGNYTVSFVNGTLNISQATATVVADDSTKVYGDADPAFTAKVEGLKNGDKEDVIAYTLSRSAGEDVSNAYEISATGEKSQGNYQVLYETGTFSITPAEVTVTAEDKAQVYGGDVAALTATVEGLQNNDSSALITYTLAREAGNDAGEYAITATGEETQGNYTVKFEGGTYTISRAPVTVTAQPKTKVYGTGDPDLTATVKGLVGNDSVAYELARATGENVGSYEIVPKGEETQGNYAVSFEKGRFDITKAQLTVKADDKSQVYGAEPTPFSATVSGLKNGDTEAVVTVAYARADGNNVGEYVITPSIENTPSNYDVVLEDGTYAIMPKAATITANNESKAYGEADPNLTAVVSGVLEDFEPAYTVVRDAGENVDKYAITVSGVPEQGNYRFTFKPAIFTITPAGTLQVNVTDSEASYNGADIAANTATANVTEGTTIEYRMAGEGGAWSEWSTEVPTARNAGIYNVEARATNANYTTAEGAYKLTINPKPITVTGVNASKIYGDPDPALSASINEGGLAEGDSADLISYTVSRTDADAEGGQNAGTHATIQPAGEEVQGNYRVSFAPGTLTINRAPVTVTVEAGQGKTYGDADPEFTATVSEQLPYGDTEDLISYTITREAGEDVKILTPDAAEGTLSTQAVGNSYGTYQLKATGAAEQGNYAVTFEDGEFTITPRSVTVRSHSDSRSYDGTPLTAQGWDVVKGNILESDAIDFTFSGTQTRVGSSENAFAVLKKAQGDRSFNYDFELERGTLTITAADVDHSHVVTKTHDGNGFKAGDVVTFTIGVKNIYDETKIITLEEQDGVTLAQSEFTLDAGDPASTTATYTITEEDVVKGAYENTVTARIDGDDVPYTATDEVTTAAADPYLVVSKVVANPADAGFALGDAIEYEVSVANTGNITVRDIVIGDALTGDRWNVGTLAPGETSQTYTTSYTVTEADIRSGYVTNVATIDGYTVPDGLDLSYEEAGITTPVSVEAPSLSVAKSITSKAGNYGAGETIVYRVAVGNNGNVTINDIQVSDPLTGDTWTVDALVPGESESFETRYQVGAADLAAGFVANTATAVGVDPDGNSVSGTATVRTTTTDADEQLNLRKIILNPQNSYKIGDTINYLIVVSNAGDVNLSNVTVADQLENASGNIVFTSAGGGTVRGSNVVFANLAAGQTRSITARYTIRAADAGNIITNTATATTSDNEYIGGRDSAVANPVEGRYSLTIHYVYANGQTAAPDYRARLLAGDAFNVASPNINGYTPSFSRLVSDSAGMPERDVELTVVYTANGRAATPGTPSGAGTATPGATPATATPAAATTPAPAGQVTIDDDGNPLVDAIDDDATPLASAEGTWSLFDVLATVLALIVALVLAIGLFGRKRGDDRASEEGEEPEKTKRHRGWRLASIGVGLAILVALLLTQDFTQPMGIFDQWSVLFAVLAVAQVVLAFLARKKSEDEEGDGPSQAPIAGTPVAAVS